MIQNSFSSLLKIGQRFQKTLAIILIASILISTYSNTLLQYVAAFGDIDTTSTRIVGVSLSRSGGTIPDGTPVPVTFGQVFRDGDIPVGKNIVLRTASGVSIDTQADVKSRYPSGAVKHAIISTITPLPVGAVRNMGIYTYDLTSLPSNQTLTGIIASGYNPSIELTLSGGGIYHASVSEALNKNGIKTQWLQGPVANEWITYMPLKNQSNQEHPHLVARFSTRAYSGGLIRNDVTIENTWTYEANPETFVYDVSMKDSSGAVRYQKNGLHHYMKSRFHIAYWEGGNDPKIDIKQDTNYLIATKAVPNYDRSFALNQTAINNEYNRIMGAAGEPMGLGLATTNYMLQTGGRPELGQEPATTARFILDQGSKTRFSMLKGGDLGGSWPIHYRDKDTDEIISIDNYPYFGIGANPNDQLNPQTGKSEMAPTCSGTGSNCENIYVPDTSHQPSFAFVPYVVTGDYYYMEELKFWANYELLDKNPHYRNFSGGLLKTDQIRGQAWGLRTLGQAAYILPDTDSSKNYFLQKIQNNLNYYTNKYINSPLPEDQLGFLGKESYSVIYTNSQGEATGIAPWQDHFFTASIGRLAEFGIPGADTFLNWKSKFVTGMMNAPGVCWLYASSYTMNVKPSATGSFFTSYADIANNTYWNTSDASGTTLNTTTCGSVEMANLRTRIAGTTIKQKEMPGYPYSLDGFGANMQPALAYAVDNGASGSLDAWNLYETRDPSQRNYPNDGYPSGPQFAIVPRSITQTTVNNGYSVPLTDIVDTENPVITGTLTTSNVNTNDYTVNGWSASDNIAVASYEISLNGGNNWINIGMSTGYTATGRTSGNTDIFNIRAIDTANNKSQILTLSITVGAIVNPNAPIFAGPLQIGTVSTGSISVAYPAATGSIDIDGYDVSTDGTNWQENAMLSSGANTITKTFLYTFTGLTSDTYYTLHIRARNSSGYTSTPLSIAQRTAKNEITTSINKTLTRLPSWLENIPIGQIVAVPNSTLKNSPGWIVWTDNSGGYIGDQKTFVNGENSLALNPASHELIMFGGGHLDYAGNEASSIDITADNPTWSPMINRSAYRYITPGTSGQSPALYADGRPSSRHTYSCVLWSQAINRFISIGGYNWPLARSGGGVLSWDPYTKQWEPDTAWPTLPAAWNNPPLCAMNNEGTKIYMGTNGGYSIGVLDVVTRKFTIIKSTIQAGEYFPGTEVPTLDTDRNEFVVLSTRAGPSNRYAKFYAVGTATGALTIRTINPSPEWTEFQNTNLTASGVGIGTNHGAITYIPAMRAYIYSFGGTGQGGKLWKITQNADGLTWDMTKLALTGATVPDGIGVANGNILKRATYMPELGGVAFLPSALAPMYFVRLHDVAISSGSTVTDITPPSAPTNLIATGITQNTASLSWNASNDDTGVTGYDIFLNSTLIGSTQYTNYTLNNLNPSTQYTVNIKARDSAGNTSSNGTVSFSTLANSNTSNSGSTNTGTTNTGTTNTGTTNTGSTNTGSASGNGSTNTHNIGWGGSSGGGNGNSIPTSTNINNTTNIPSGTASGYIIPVDFVGSGQINISSGIVLSPYANVKVDNHLITIKSPIGEILGIGNVSIIPQSTWDGNLVAPYISTGVTLQLSSSGVSNAIPRDNLVTTYSHLVSVTIKAGSNTTPLQLSGGTFTLSFSVSGSNIPVGVTLKVVRSDDGINWIKNTPSNSCIIDSNFMCTVETDHFSYFGGVYSVPTFLPKLYAAKNKIHTYTENWLPEKITPKKVSKQNQSKIVQNSQNPKIDGSGKIPTTKPEPPIWVNPIGTLLFKFEIIKNQAKNEFIQLVYDSTKGLHYETISPIW